MLPQLKVFQLEEARILTQLPVCVIGHPLLSLVRVYNFSVNENMDRLKADEAKESIKQLHYKCVKSSNTVYSTDTTQTC